MPSPLSKQRLWVGDPLLERPAVRGSLSPTVIHRV
jgi:hypothetical protein